MWANIHIHSPINTEIRDDIPNTMGGDFVLLNTVKVIAMYSVCVTEALGYTGDKLVNCVVSIIAGVLVFLLTHKKEQ